MLIQAACPHYYSHTSLMKPQGTTYLDSNENGTIDQSPPNNEAQIDKNASQAQHLITTHKSTETRAIVQLRNFPKILKIYNLINYRNMWDALVDDIDTSSMHIWEEEASHSDLENDYGTQQVAPIKYIAYDKKNLISIPIQKSSTFISPNYANKSKPSSTHTPLSDSTPLIPINFSS